MLNDSFQVIVLLVQEAIYICNLGSKEEERKKEILVMAEAIDEEDADAGECQKYDLVKKLLFLDLNSVSVLLQQNRL
jgi:hypothetical protein